MFDTRVKITVATSRLTNTNTQTEVWRGHTRAKNLGFSLGLGATKTM